VPKLIEQCDDPQYLLLLTSEERQALWRQLGNTIENYIENIAALRVASPMDLGEIHSFLDCFTFDRPIPAAEAISRVSAELIQYQVHTPHPCCFGTFDPASTTLGVLAEALVAALNPQLSAWSVSPLAVSIEQHLIASFAHRFGYAASDVDGTFTSGGSEANHTAVLCALATRWPSFIRDGVRACEGKP